MEDLLNSTELDPCQMCQRGMRMAKEFSLQAPEYLSGVLRELCAKYSFRRLDACAGLMERLSEQLVGIFSEMNLEGSDGYYACAYSFPGSCPVPLHQPADIAFPKAKPVNAVQPAPSGQTIQVLHFSDWHLDPLYKVGSEAKCSHNICCRDYGSWNDPGPIKKRASKWGDGKCDTPIALGLNTLETIPKFVPNASFGLFTGDIVSHDAWMISEKYVADEEIRSYELFKKYLQDLKLYVAMGNHDSYPSDQAPGRQRPDSYITHKWLYDHVAGIWEKNNWITSIEAEYARSHNAMFMTRPMDGLKLITLNTDLYYVRNFFTMLDTNLDDPSGMLHDLVLELQDSEDRGERVWIMGHMAPITRSLPRSSLLFQKIVARYSPHVIAGIFTGHYHQDKFIVVHDPDALEQTEESALNVIYQGPSVTPLDRSNPAIRWYDVDAKTFSILNTHTAVADIIGQGAYWEANDMEPEWKHEYSARETYADPADPLDPEDPLSPAFWHRTVERMKEDRELFKTYLQYESKLSEEAKPCHKGSACEYEALCQMQASTVVQHQQCTEDAETLKGTKNKKKPNKKKPFSVTRAGKEVIVGDYDEERGYIEGLGVERRGM
ncbi:Metallo-dependent phosphatase-like protein [Lobosporangium transversale]|uniref:Sphingomyelin phosphodiesterase n=1 Tax=Lobosporangium transversale TaxID=64571 RepID=A0A1Y2GN80_9FUNG|nr:Metallo-dependent phosphatase-like protein [Lobosporangium transversale]ORZ16157.1 Metallo-dependent phosphatase-like protein [Lobosporangium transversale]|eukprot:XP_021881504.1 Metallo-dependent phosphatase-like protein [Lobosporangium transversale]